MEDRWFGLGDRGRYPCQYRTAVSSNDSGTIPFWTGYAVFGTPLTTLLLYLVAAFTVVSHTF